MNELSPFSFPNISVVLTHAPSFLDTSHIYGPFRNLILPYLHNILWPKNDSPNRASALIRGIDSTLVLLFDLLWFPHIQILKLLVGLSPINAHGQPECLALQSHRLVGLKKLGHSALPISKSCLLISGNDISVPIQCDTGSATAFVITS